VTQPVEQPSLFARGRKAFVAAFLAAVAAFFGGALDGSPVDSLADWLAVVSAAIVAGFAVFWTKNAKSLQEPVTYQRGGVVDNGL
jgi:hypothetical protein